MQKFLPPFGSLVRWRAKELAIVAMVLCTLFTSKSSADILRTGSKSTVVRVQTFDRQFLNFTEGCEGSQIKTISWTSIETVAFEAECGSATNDIAAAISQCSEKDPLDVFAINFKGLRSPLIAESVALSADRIIHLDIFQPWENAHGALSSVRSISKVKICRDRIAEVKTFPEAYCHEPRKLAVAFDYNTPLSNKILTNGFSFVIQSVGALPTGFDFDAFGEEVRSAFQAGITLWTTSLKDREGALSENLRAFLTKRTSTSPNGYSLFLPPQVVRLSCPQSATFVVELGFQDDELFPSFPLVLARAKIEGRTVALNMRSFKCFKSELKFDNQKHLKFELDGGCINLIPIMAHELGHAFGLNHFDDPSSHALMDSIFSRDSLTPTNKDSLALAVALEQTVQGAGPGVLKFVSSSGVRPPLDWSAETLSGP